MIWALILAAGESKRMGKTKLLLRFGEKTMVETVIEKALHSKAEKVLVVLGSDWEKIEERIKNLPVEIAVNHRFHRGMLSSVQLGFQIIPEDAQAALILLGDQPFIPVSIINRIIDTFKTSKKGIVIPVYNKGRGHPVLIEMKYREEVNQLSPNVGLRGLVYSHPEDTLEVAVDSPGILKDIDTLQDYERALRQRR